MLVLTTIEPEALNDTGNVDPPLARTLSSLILSTLRTHCVLVFTSEQHRQQFADAIRSMPLALRERWLAVLPTVRTHPPLEVADIGQMSSLADVCASLSGKVELVACEQIRAAVLGVDDSDGTVVDDCGIEVSRIDALPMSQAIARVRALALADVAAGTNREHIWNERFRPLASVSRSVTVVDRYGIADLRRQRRSGLKWTLARLDSGRVRKLSLILGSNGDSQDSVVAEVRRAFHSSQQLGGSIEQVEVVICPDRAFYNAHGRYIRFDQSHAIMVEPGFSTFGDSQIRQSFPCPLVELDSQTERERLLRSEALDRAVIQRR